MQLFASATTVVQAASGEAEKLPILPHSGELIFGLVAIAILYVIVPKKVVPNLEKAYAERTAAIEGGMQQGRGGPAPRPRPRSSSTKRSSREARAEASAHPRGGARARARRSSPSCGAQAQAEAARITESAKKQIRPSASRRSCRCARGGPPVHRPGQPHRR